MQVTLEGKKSERATVKQKLGFVPTSVWQLKKDKKLQSLIADDSKYVFDDAVGKRTIPGSGGKIARFSEFNPTVAQACIRIWSKRGDVVLDPFMNRGTIVFVAKYLGRNGIAGEVVKKYYEDTKKRYERFKRRVQNDNWVKLYNWDATQMGKYLERESVDLVLTSPPFWDVEPYESAPGQMADIEDYPTFLFKYYQVIKAAHAVLKPGGIHYLCCERFPQTRQILSVPPRHDEFV